MDEARNQGQRLNLEQAGGREGDAEHQGVHLNQGHSWCPASGCWEGGQEERPFTQTACPWFLVLSAPRPD